MSPTRRVPLSKIIVDVTIQQRSAGSSEELIDEYAQAMSAGDQFPSLVVFSSDEAYRRAHPEALDIECEVRSGGYREALLFACGANTTHGLRLTRADKQKAVLTLFGDEEWSQWSDRKIAKHCNVSHTFVSTVRREHLATLPDGNSGKGEAQPISASPTVSKTPNPSPVPASTRKARRGDQSYSIDTTRIGSSKNKQSERVGRSLSSSSTSAPLGSYVWTMVEPSEQRKFVDGVGLRQLYNAASPDHRDAFVAWLLAGLPQSSRPERLQPNVEMYLDRFERQSSSEDGLDIPGFPCRRSAYQRSPENAHPADPAPTEEMLILAEQLGGNCRSSNANSSPPASTPTKKHQWSNDDGGD
jgi:hypothetical protein